MDRDAAESALKEIVLVQARTKKTGGHALGSATKSLFNSGNVDFELRTLSFVFIMFCLNWFLSSSDDQLEDSDSDEHSRSESVTGMSFPLIRFDGALT